VNCFMLFSLDWKLKHTWLCAGDAVFGLAHGCLGTAVSGPAAMLVPMPSNISFIEASTIPTVFTTVHIALKVASNLKHGENVLIHASAGGVGLAAIQVAKSLGANVISTAGSESKRYLLHSIGTEHVLGSRNTRFADELCILGGADVILNSLTSSGMISGSIAASKVGARFVEISKRDIWSSLRIVQERPDMQYSLLAVDFLPSDVLNTTLTHLSSELCAGRIRPLRQITHTMGSVANAMRQLSQASHVGKVVASTDRLKEHAYMDQSASVTISGGVGGLGLMISDWIITHYKYPAVNLLGRSGKVNEDQSWKQLSNSTVSLVVSMADFGCAEDIVTSLEEQGLHMTNLMHASGILRDSLLEKQSLKSFKEVFAPKISITKQNWSSLPLNSVTLFSSVASLLGGAGQGNYASANAYLDSWAYDQQLSGSSVKSVQWGAWASSGMASDSVLRRLERIGQGMITAEQGLSSLNSILSLHGGLQTSPVISVNGFVWPTYLKNESSDIFSEFVEKGKSRESEAKAVRKQPKSPSQQVMSLDVVLASVKEAIIQVVGADVDDDEPLMAAGLDSLGSVEFSNVLAQKFSMQMPGTLIFDYPSARAVTEFLLTQVPSNIEDDISEEDFSPSPQTKQVVPSSSHTLTPFAGQVVYVKGVHLQEMQQKNNADFRYLITETGLMRDVIQSIPFSRWDLDRVDTYLGDSFSLSAQVLILSRLFFIRSLEIAYMYLIVLCSLVVL